MCRTDSHMDGKRDACRLKLLFDMPIKIAGEKNQTARTEYKIQNTVSVTVGRTRIRSRIRTG